HASAAVSIAWLEAPEGSQLLLVANENSTLLIETLHISLNNMGKH
ncbi:DUF1481 domain-containing protein, partial [Klebsiella pneumoniae]